MRAQKLKQKDQMDRMVQQELNAQQKDDENRAHRAKMADIDQRLKDKQDALKRLDAESAAKRQLERERQEAMAARENKRKNENDKKNAEV